MTHEGIKTISNKDLVLFALYRLGGAERTVHTEDIAAEVFRHPLGRQTYSWERYTQYPDKERVARELRRLKKSKEAPMVEGHVNVGAKSDRIDGWRLTSAGVERVKAIEARVLGAAELSGPYPHRYSVHSLRGRISSSSCYRMYLTDAELRQAVDHDFTDMLYCLPDAPDSAVRTAHERLMANARAVNATDLVVFLEAARRRFSRFFRE